jgi:2-polyprenyl-3-methyl-5-hydroxy-6-metoxy-1,4-benzoquinol methylase
MAKEHIALHTKHDIERRFHDEKAASKHGAEQGDFYTAGGVNEVWHAYLAAIGDLRGKTVLDFGCGEGWSTLAYAKAGARVYSFDISIESVRNLQRDAAQAGVCQQIYPAVMAAESLGYPANTFDFVLGVSILHHVDLQLVGLEIQRVLKPDGRALFIEPLAHNWFLQLFRWLTPRRRTPTEQPMTVQQIYDFGRYFRQAGFQGYALMSTLPQGLLLATGNQHLFRWSLRLTQPADRWLLKALPSLQRYCWSALIEMKK